MGTLTVQIPGLPPLWTPVLFQQSTKHPRDAVVMCERTNSRAFHVDNFVVWSVNMIEGGCTGGTYCDTYEKASLEFNRRKGRLS